MGRTSEPTMKLAREQYRMMVKSINKYLLHLDECTKEVYTRYRTLII